LRSQLSQGLFLPFTATTAILIGAGPGAKFSDYEGYDVSALFGIVKYEAPVNPQLAGDVKGAFPIFIPKTDQERIQNLSAELAQWKTEAATWTITEKCEGSSFTAFVHEGVFGVCSRNLELKESDANSLWQAAYKYDLPTKMLAMGRNIAVQAELIGPKIQGNIYQLTSHTLAVFDVFDIIQRDYLSPSDCKAVIDELGLTSAPILDTTFSLDLVTIQDLLTLADGATVIGKSGCRREGLVFKNNAQRVSFKVVSNAYLLKSDN
jgi:RNA ligase (TIGR02306 family)